MKNIYNTYKIYKIDMDINFEYYKIFYFVGKYGNITKAAAALGSNQPNVTRAMKLLEAQLNCRLFYREARGVRLTEEGRLLYERVEVAYRNLMNAQEEICRLSSSDSLQGGTIEIGATESALHLFLLNMLRKFKQEYPGIRIKIHNHTTRETVRRLVGRELDFAVVTTPFEAPKTVSCLKVLEFREILAGGPLYRKLGERPRTLEEIKNYPLVGLGRGTATYELYKNFFVSCKIDMELDMEVATSDLMLPLLENNFGIGFVPEQLALPLIEEGKLVRIPVECSVPKRSVQVISHMGRGKSLAADVFYKVVSET